MCSSDLKVEQNGSPGYVVRSFRTFYSNDGSVARQEQLSRDTYRPLNRRVLEGPSNAEVGPGQEVPEGDPDTSENPQDNECEDVGMGQGDRSRVPLENNERVE